MSYYDNFLTVLDFAFSLSIKRIQIMDK
jgi:hypothetical protein